MSWIYEEDTEIQKPRKKKLPFQSQGLVVYLKSGSCFLYTKTESTLYYIISEFTKQGFHLPLILSVLNRQAPKTVGESIQLEKQKMC